MILRAAFGAACFVGGVAAGMAAGIVLGSSARKAARCLSNCARSAAKSQSGPIKSEPGGESPPESASAAAPAG